MRKEQFGFTLIGFALTVLLLSPSVQAAQKIAFGIYGGGEASNQGQTIEQVVKGGQTAFVQFQPGSKLSFVDCPVDLCSVQEGVFETAVSGVYLFGIRVAFSAIPENTTAELGFHIDGDSIPHNIQGACCFFDISPIHVFLGRHPQSRAGFTVFCKGVGPCIIDISNSHFSGHLIYKRGIGDE